MNLYWTCKLSKGDNYSFEENWRRQRQDETMTRGLWEKKSDTWSQKNTTDFVIHVATQKHGDMKWHFRVNEGKLVCLLNQPSTPIKRGGFASPEMRSLIAL